MMEKRMSVIGIGHEAGIIVGGHLLLTIALNYLFTPVFRMTQQAYPALLTAGIVLAAVGFSLCLIAAYQMLKAYKKDSLVTTGLYRLFLNPMYFFQLFLTLPGIALVFNSWLVLTVVPVSIVVVKMLIKKEENYLKN